RVQVAVERAGNVAQHGDRFGREEWRVRPCVTGGCASAFPRQPVGGRREIRRPGRGRGRSGESSGAAFGAAPSGGGRLSAVECVEGSFQRRDRKSTRLNSS